MPGMLRRDLVAAYVAAAARALSWAAVSAVVYRIDAAAFATLALVRGTIGILNYTTLGLAPAMVRMLATPLRFVPPLDDPAAPHGEAVSADQDLVKSYSNGLFLAAIAGIAGALLTVAYAAAFTRVHRLPASEASPTVLVLALGLGIVLRLLSDVPAAVLQTRGKIALDHTFLAAADLSWVAAAATGHFLFTRGVPILNIVGVAYFFSSLLLLVGRWGAAVQMFGRGLPALRCVERRLIVSLLGFGLLVVVSQMGDFLYAPTDYILINRLISPAAVAVYAPAVQIDAGLLLLTSGLSAVLLPTAALAHGRGDRRAVRRFYLRGSLSALAAVLAGALLTWLMVKPLLRIWLGADQPATRAILPLLLIHTVAGGASGVGRSVLLAIGRARAYTAAVLLAGAANVLLSYIFVAWLGWGLRGIVLGTVTAVVARCLLWMPWYTLRALRDGARVGTTGIYRPSASARDDRLHG